jgi:hypothetical protein
MKPTSPAYRALAIAIVICVFAVAVYRAKTQSIAHDEALTYVWFLDGPVDKMLRADSNNHVLFTFLAKPCVQFLGVTEFSLRLPTLLGAAGYLTGSLLLSAELFGDGIWFALSVALLSLNPTIMDFLAAARGYGLGLACLCGAVLFLTRATRVQPIQPGNQRLRTQWALASVLLALAVAANLTNLIPALSLAGALAVMLRPQPGDAAQASSLRKEVAQWFVWPGLAVGFSLLWPFLLQARRREFIVGYASAADSLRDLFDSSFLYRWTEDRFSGLSATPLSPESWQRQVSTLGVFLVLPLLLLFLFAGFLLLRKTNRSRACRLLVGAVLGCLALNLAFHFVFHMKYPLCRICLYLIPLFTLSGLVLVRDLSATGKRRWLPVIALALCTVAVLGYAAEIHTANFRYNAYDDISRDMFLSISRDARQQGLANPRTAGTWWYWPEMNFYRRRYHSEWISTYDIKDPSQAWANADNALRPADYDYFIYTPQNIPDLAGHRVRTVFQSDRWMVTVVQIDR